MTLAEIEKKAIFAAITRCKGNKLKAARTLAIGKTTLYRKLNEYKKTKKKARNRRRGSKRR
jgi:DNA-binding NtrC family response regulator